MLTAYSFEEYFNAWSAKCVGLLHPIYIPFSIANVRLFLIYAIGLSGLT